MLSLCRSTMVRMSRSSTTTSATAERADAAAKPNIVKGSLHRPGAHADRAEPFQDAGRGVLVYLR
jgi:hypothetical protein